MSVYAMLRDAAYRGQLAVDDVELKGVLDGNLCRCTGYAPILAAVKSFVGDYLNAKAVPFNFDAAGMPATSSSECCARKPAPEQVSTDRTLPSRHSLHCEPLLTARLSDGAEPDAQGRARAQRVGAADRRHGRRHGSHGARLWLVDQCCSGPPRGIYEERMRARRLLPAQRQRRRRRRSVRWQSEQAGESVPLVRVQAVRAGHGAHLSSRAREARDGAAALWLGRAHVVQADDARAIARDQTRYA